MKLRNKLYISMAGTALMLSACNKKLNLTPYQQISQSTALATAADVQITLVGAYNRAGQADLYGGGVFLYPDLMATQTQIQWQGTYQTLTQMSNQALLSTNSAINAVWLDGYQVINQANNVLANISKVTTANQNRTTGEAEFLRGMTYFDLVRLFGRAWNDNNGDPATNLGVPIVTTPTTEITASSYPSRSTVAKVYAQSIADLTDAESKLPTSNGVYATKYAAEAILARLYLQKGDYANAAAEANKVISGNAYQLVDYSSEFSYPVSTPGHVDNTTEDVFAMQVTSQQGTNYLNTFYASADHSGRGDIIIRSGFLTGFETGDLRLNVYNEDSDGILRNDKFDNLYGNVHVVRLAEMYLIRAEANFRLGTTTGATPVSDINTIRTRAGLKSLTTVTLSQILTERVHELAFEGGFFFHDGKRLQQTIGSLRYDSPKLVFPIPFQDITANPNLVQNPGY